MKVVSRDTAADEAQLPREVAYSAGVTGDLADHFYYKIVDGGYVDSDGLGHYSPFGMVFVFFDKRTMKEIAIIPFTAAMREGLHDAEFDFWGYLLPQVRRRVLDYIWYENREAWDNPWPLSQYLSAWEGVLTGSRSYESFREACEYYAVPMPVEWGEAERTESFMSQMHDQHNYYYFMQACDYYGYYPKGHHKERVGTWAGVIKFGMRLVIALIASSTVGGGGKHSRQP